MRNNSEFQRCYSVVCLFIILNYTYCESIWIFICCSQWLCNLQIYIFYYICLLYILCYSLQQRDSRKYSQHLFVTDQRLCHLEIYIFLLYFITVYNSVTRENIWTSICCSRRSCDLEMHIFLLRLFIIFNYVLSAIARLMKIYSNIHSLYINDYVIWKFTSFIARKIPSRVINGIDNCYVIL